MTERSFARAVVSGVLDPEGGTPDVVYPKGWLDRIDALESGEAKAGDWAPQVVAQVQGKYGERSASKVNPDTEKKTVEIRIKASDLVDRGADSG